MTPRTNDPPYLKFASEVLSSERWTPTPLLPATVIGNRLGCDLWLKREDCTPIGSFKLRGALVAMAQTDVKKLVAYSSVSHLGFVMLGVFALNEQGVLGGQLQMINHGISTGALFLLVGMVYERRHTREISEFGGLSKQVPIYSTIFAITMLSSIGLPGLNGFVGEFLILLGAFKASYIYAAFAVIGIVLGAAYMLWLFQRMFFGTLDNPENQKLTDCNPREIADMLPMIVLMFWIGLYPRPFLARMEASVAKVVKMVNVAEAPQNTKAAALPKAGNSSEKNF